MIIEILVAIVVVSYLLIYIIPTYANKFCQIIKKMKHSNSKDIYLTFDDGPSQFTNELLQVLKNNKVKATFFVVVDFALKYPEIINKIKAQGHVIGFHSYNHSNGLLEYPWQEVENFSKSLKGLRRLNIKTIYFRPPWGHINLAMVWQIKKYKLQMVMWDVMAEDWKKTLHLK